MTSNKPTFLESVETKLTNLLSQDKTANYTYLTGGKAFAKYLSKIPNVEKLNPEFLARALFLYISNDIDPRNSITLSELAEMYPGQVDMKVPPTTNLVNYMFKLASSDSNSRLFRRIALFAHSIEAEKIPTLESIYTYYLLMQKSNKMGL